MLALVNWLPARALVFVLQVACVGAIFGLQAENERLERDERAIEQHIQADIDRLVATAVQAMIEANIEEQSVYNMERELNAEAEVYKRIEAVTEYEMAPLAVEAPGRVDEVRLPAIKLSALGGARGIAVLHVFVGANQVSASRSP